MGVTGEVAISLASGPNRETGKSMVVAPLSHLKLTYLVYRSASIEPSYIGIASLFFKSEPESCSLSVHFCATHADGEWMSHAGPNSSSSTRWLSYFSVMLSERIHPA